MVKITCPVCGGKGHVPVDFGTPYEYHPIPFWWGCPTTSYTTNLQHNPTITTTTQSATASCTYYTSYGSKPCPACGGTGLQECDHTCCKCHRKCCCHHIKPHDEKEPCMTPQPYIPFEGYISTDVGNTFTLFCGCVSDPLQKTRTKKKTEDL
jgi:hypothetical protein